MLPIACRRIPHVARCWLPGPRTALAREYRSRFSEALAGESVFAGEYILVQWGCGTACVEQAFVSKRSGEVLDVRFGGGYGPLFACDLAFASDDAKFGLSEINWGILPGGGASKVAQELMPSRKAMYHAMMGENLTGKQAEEQGLITEAVPADQLLARVTAIAEVLKKKDGHALRATKWTMRRMVDMTYDNGLEYQIRAQEALHSFGGAEARREATRQFLDEKSFKPGLGTFDTSKVER